MVSNLKLVDEVLEFLPNKVVFMLNEDGHLIGVDNKTNKIHLYEVRGGRGSILAETITDDNVVRIHKLEFCEEGFSVNELGSKVFVFEPKIYNPVKLYLASVSDIAKVKSKVREDLSNIYNVGISLNLFSIKNEEPIFSFVINKKVIFCDERFNVLSLRTFKPKQPFADKYIELEQYSQIHNLQDLTTLLGEDTVSYCLVKCEKGLSNRDKNVLIFNLSSLQDLNNDEQHRRLRIKLMNSLQLDNGRLNSFKFKNSSSFYFKIINKLKFEIKKWLTL